MRRTWMIVLAGVLTASVSAADPPSVPQLIERLGSDQFTERQEASQALDALGSAALDELRQAAKSPDPEVRRRALVLVKQIEKRQSIHQVLAPHKVNLKFQDAPLPDVLVDLSKKTGFKVMLDPKAEIADRKVTIDTGEVTFWEAFDKFCESANLIETTPAQEPFNPGIRSSSVIILGGGNRTTPTDILKPDPPEKEDVLIVADGKPRSLPTQRQGALRVVALPASTSIPGYSPQTGESMVILEVAVEPRLKWLQVLTVRVGKAVDDQEQTLTGRYSFLGKPVHSSMGTTRMFINGQPVYNDDSGPQGQAARQVPIRLLRGEKAAKTLTELQGTLTGLVQTPTEELVKIDKVAKAVGESVAGVGGASLKVLETSTTEEGYYQIRFHVVSPPRGIEDGSTAMSSAFVMINGRIVSGYNDEPLSALNFALLDDKGKPFEVVRATNTGKRAGSSREIELAYKVEEGMGEPTKLIYTGRRTQVVEVPFTFKDVPLP